MFNNNDINLNDLEKFSAKFGKNRLNAVLKVLGKGTIFIQAMETEIGKELLNESVERLVELLESIADDPDCNRKLKIEYQILRGICRRWAARIMNFYNAKTTLKELVK